MMNPLRSFLLGAILVSLGVPIAAQTSVTTVGGDLQEFFTGERTVDQ